MSKQITVEYPHIEEKVLRTAEQMKAAGYKAMPQIAYLPVNRKQYVQVKTSAPAIDLDQMCLDQTGLTPAQYQAKFKRAWND